MQFYIVDVFAEAPYSGNQLAVFRGHPDPQTMLQIAQEVDYSETTFVTADQARAGGYDVRIFTSVSELPFAGHPTLGTAVVIRDKIIGQAVEQVTLNLPVGKIDVRFADDGFIWMRQKPPQFGHIYDAEAVAAMLGVETADMDTRYPIQEVSTGLPFIIAPMTSLDAVRRATVNLPRFKQMIQQGQAALGADAIFVFCAETVHAANDLHARSFVHLHGAPEDPATGSANGNVAGWLSQHAYFGSDRVQARVEQGYSLDRPSLLLLDAHADADRGIVVNVGGRVRWVAEGRWLIE
jgi:trans-2,3-dihydro-3-hydroxyanthranilate isomerase